MFPSMQRRTWCCLQHGARQLQPQLQDVFSSLSIHSFPFSPPKSALHLSRHRQPRHESSEGARGVAHMVNPADASKDTARHGARSATTCFPACKDGHGVACNLGHGSCNHNSKMLLPQPGVLQPASGAATTGRTPEWSWQASLLQP